MILLDSVVPLFRSAKCDTIPKVMDGITGIEDRLQDEVSDTIMKMTEALGSVGSPPGPSGPYVFGQMSSSTCFDAFGHRKIWKHWVQFANLFESSLHIQKRQKHRSAAMVFHSCK